MTGIRSVMPPAPLLNENNAIRNEEPQPATELFRMANT